MAVKRSEIPGAVPRASTIQDVGEALRPYFVKGMRELVQGMTDTAIAMGEDPLAKPWIQQLHEAIDAGGRWQLHRIRATDAREVESEWDDNRDIGLAFVDNALSFGCQIQDATRPGREPLASILFDGSSVRIEVKADDTDIIEIHAAVHDIFAATVPPPPVVETIASDTVTLERGPHVFIGHGGDRQWEVVQEAVENAGYVVDVFEADERAGQPTLDVVRGMVSRSRVGVIIMTAADTHQDGTRHARPNVIHELGLCHGLLGVGQTFVVLERGVTVPTNVAGHIEIRFPHGELHTVRDRILRAIEQRVAEPAD